MKAKVLLFAILLVFAACGKKQEVLAVVLEKETGTTPTTYTTVPIGSTHMTMPIMGYDYCKLYLKVCESDFVVVKEVSKKDAVLINIGDTIKTTIRIK